MGVHALRFDWIKGIRLRCHWLSTHQMGYREEEIHEVQGIEDDVRIDENEYRIEQEHTNDK